MDLNRHMHDGRVAVGVTVAQGELAALVPVEAHRGLVFAERAQPGDQPGFAVVRNDCHLASIGWDDLLVVWVLADERPGHQQVWPTADGDAPLFRLLVVDPGEGRQIGGEVRVPDDVAGTVG